MLKGRRLSVCLSGICFCLVLWIATGMTTMAETSKNYLDSLNAGVSAIIDPSAYNSLEIASRTTEALKDVQAEQEEESTLVMANVKSALNVRMEPSEESEKIGKLYKDCGGTILERGNGWTKLQSGNIIGWAKDEYLYFGDEAEALADDVGTLLATINTETLRVRKEPTTDSEIHGLLPKGEEMEVVEKREDGWICVDYEGGDGFVSAEYVDIHFLIDSGETMDEIKAREQAEKEAKLKLVTNYGAATVGADDTMLLAALIQCESGGEPYEGQLAVGAVVMNRVRSGAYPDNVYGVIYASGQFTPALSGKVDRLFLSGKIRESCMQAAQEAIGGATNIGEATHFRRNNGTREGYVIGNHVFW